MIVKSLKSNVQGGRKDFGHWTLDLKVLAKGDRKKPFSRFELNLFLQVGDFSRNRRKKDIIAFKPVSMAINNLERLHRKGHQSPVHSNVGSIIVAKVTNSAEVPSPDIYFTTNKSNAKNKNAKHFKPKLLLTANDFNICKIDFLKAIIRKK